MTLYEKVQILCKNNGFEISNLGDKIPGISITKGSISKWKSGAVPRAATIKAIAEYFGVTPEYLTSSSEDIATGIIQDNHGIIGHAHAPVTIVNGSEKKLTEQGVALLDLFNQMDVIKQAQLLTYAADLIKK